VDAAGAGRISEIPGSVGALNLRARRPARAGVAQRAALSPDVPKPSWAVI
jgi:hypothetical protein